MGDTLDATRSAPVLVPHGFIYQTYEQVLGDGLNLLFEKHGINTTRDVFGRRSKGILARFFR